MVMAPVAAERELALRQLLEAMNTEPGLVDPHNALLPFAEFDRLHYARLVILEDATLGDMAIHHLPARSYPKYLVFMGDCDGAANDILADLVQRAEAGLRKIFMHCTGFDAQGDLLQWLCANDQPVAANYVNWAGRTVLQVRQESALQRVFSARVPRTALRSGSEAQQVRRELVKFAREELGAGRLVLARPVATPLLRKIANLAHALFVPLLLGPPLILLAPIIVVLLRIRETRDPEYCPPPDEEALRALRLLEDRDVTNQFSALGAVKPGLFRRWLVTVILVAINYACRHLFNRGHLGRVRTIHFARWVFIDNKQRIIFASNYDGSHEAYMDDFINKVAWGLNLIFSNGVGWPRTAWLIKQGARHEERFKRYQRRHQIPTQVWYKAYPGLTTLDMIRNHRIRVGFECDTVTDAQALAWLRLL